MSPVLTPMSIVLLAGCIVAEVSYQLSFKSAADRADPRRYARSIVLQPLLWFGIVLWAAEVVGWIMVLQHAPLAIAYPVMTLTYAGVPLAGVFMLKEKMSRSQIAGAGLVLIGVISVSMARA
jgi:drug/metabolite transporter (DMT)-like permease